MRPARRLKLLAVLALLPFGALTAYAALGLGGGEGSAPVAERVAPPAQEEPAEPRDPALRPRPKVVEIAGAGSDVPLDEDGDEDGSESGEKTPGQETDAEVRAQLAELEEFRAVVDSPGGLQLGPRARVLPDGTAVAPRNAPRAVKLVIKAGNQIARTPYRWGGGHAGWTDTGYDCSGSVSYALYGARLLESPLASGAFAGWGAPGQGRWITIYTNPGHIFMVVAGLRFDTSGRGDRGTRWQEGPRSTAGFVVRHYPGL